MKALLTALLGLSLAVPAATPHAGNARGAFAVGAEVVARSDPDRLRAVPLPLPGHLLREDAQGRAWFYDGDADDAQAFYRARMHQAGFTLQAERHAGPVREMQWSRAGDTVLVRLESGVSATATRIRVAAVAAR